MVTLPKPQPQLQPHDTTTLLRRFDDLLTSLVVDKLALWFTTRKFQPKDPVISRVTKSSLEYEIAALVFRQVILNSNVKLASLDVHRLIVKYNLIPKTLWYNPKVLTDHAQLYLQMYHPEAGYELGNTRQYDSLNDKTAFGSTYGEACILATQEFCKGATLNFLQGKRSALTPEQLTSLKEEGQDFSVIVSVRSLKSCLLLGPIRFVNHDCEPNTVFRFMERNVITLQANRAIQFGEEITVSYGDNYFGVNNCECLCVTCERKNRIKKPEISTSLVPSRRYVTRHAVTETSHYKHSLLGLLPKEPNNLPYFEKKESSPETFARESRRLNVPIRNTCSKFRAFFDILFANPSFKTFRLGFNAWPPELTDEELKLFGSHDQILDCEWCHNVSRQTVLPRSHIPIIFIPPDTLGFSEVDEHSGFAHVSQFIHQLGRNVNLCMKCYRHYELFALPWPYREYSERVQGYLTRPYSPPPISVVVPKRKIMEFEEYISDEEMPVRLFRFSLRRRRLHALRARMSQSSTDSSSPASSRAPSPIPASLPGPGSAHGSPSSSLELSSDSSLTPIFSSSKSSYNPSPCLRSGGSSDSNPPWHPKDLLDVATPIYLPSIAADDGKVPISKLDLALDDNLANEKNSLVSSNTSFVIVEEVALDENVKPPEETSAVSHIPPAKVPDLTSEVSDKNGILPETDVPLPSQEMMALSASSCLKNSEPQTNSVTSHQPLDIILVSSTSEFIFNSWVGLIIPDCTKKSCCSFVNSDPTQLVTVHRFDNKKTELVKPSNIYTLDGKATKLSAFLSRRPWFLNKPGMRAALAFSESDKTICHGSSGDPGKSSVGLADLIHSCSLRNHLAHLEYNQLLDRYSCQEGEKWQAVFPHEGFTHLGVTVVGLMVFDGTLNIPDLRHQFHYYVKLHGTNTHRWIRPHLLLTPTPSSVSPY